jgi:hydrophobic/amphiphilic exporter-1 (mainly G- bacteria), HAE1 family
MNIAQLSIKRPILVIMIVLAIITLGILGYSKLPVDLMPSVDIPVIIVQSSYLGASTEEIESLLTKPLENALSSVAGLDTMTSTSYEGVSVIVLEFKLDVDVKFAEIDVREKVQTAQQSLPQDATPPAVRRFSMDDTPILRLSIAGNKSQGDLRDIKLFTRSVSCQR